MKISIVPAEMTSIRDRIIGNLNMSQVILLALPLVVVIVIYIFAPPFSKLSFLKIVIGTLLMLINGILSINIEGKLILEHLRILISFFNRPRIYLNTIKGLDKESEIIEISEVPESSILPPPIVDRKKIFNPTKKDKIIFNLGKKGVLNAKVLRTF